ncbi:MAG: hypothetical protein WDN69_27435 [Aliidongia sp.]
MEPDKAIEAKGVDATRLVIPWTSTLVSTKQVDFGANVVHGGAPWRRGLQLKMVGKDKVRFSITLPKSLDARLAEVGDNHRPKLSKQFLVELAVTRLVDAIDSSQLRLPLDFSERR